MGFIVNIDADNNSFYLSGEESLEHLEDDAHYHYPPNYIAENFVDIHLTAPRTIDFNYLTGSLKTFAYNVACG